MRAVAFSSDRRSVCNEPSSASSWEQAACNGGLVVLVMWDVSEVVHPACPIWGEEHIPR